MPKKVVEQSLTNEDLDRIVERELAGLTVPSTVEVKTSDTLKSILAKRTDIQELTEQDVAKSIMRVLKKIRGFGTFPKIVSCEFWCRGWEITSIKLKVGIAPPFIDPMDVPGPDNVVNYAPERKTT